jgi:leucine dehydrogenase
MSEHDQLPSLTALLKTEEDLFAYAERMKFGDIHLKIDCATGLKAIIALHSTKNGPALGGCRWLPYATTGDALLDAMRLARGMSYKSALLGIPHGGGKAVLLRPPVIKDREAYFKSYAEFVNQMNGRYITAVDSGTTNDDMDIIYKHTPYVASGSHFHGSPSPSTAVGVFNGIKAAVEFKLGKTSLEGIHVAIQGVGEVGHPLAKLLHEAGAVLTVADMKTEATESCAKEFGAKVVSINEIVFTACDVFAPCALGAVINDVTISKLQTAIIAGSANNQLARSQHGVMLHERGILYAPDYVINAGGLVYAASKYAHLEGDVITFKLGHIYDTLLEIFERSARENIPPSKIADTIAQERL